MRPLHIKKRLSTWLMLSLLIALAIGTWWAAQYAQHAIAIDPPKRLTHEMDSWSKNFMMMKTDPQGLPLHRLEGQYAKHFPDTESYEIQQVRVIGRRPNTPITLSTAHEAIVAKDNVRIELKGKAYIHRYSDANHEAFDMRSDEFILLPKEGVMFTRLFAEILQKRLKINGQGMYYDNKTQRLQVFQSTQVDIAPKYSASTTARRAS